MNKISCRTKKYLTKIVTVYIVYDLDALPRNSTSNFKSKNCLFVAINIVKIVIKNYVYSKYGITFDSADSWSFDNDFAGNVIISSADNSSSSHFYNRKKTF